MKVFTKNMHAYADKILKQAFEAVHATLAGLPARRRGQLESVMNSEARLISNAKKRDHITPLHRACHWLRVPK